MKNKEMAQIEAHYKKEIKSIKCEVVRLINLLEQVLSFKNEKGTSAQPPMKTPSAHVPDTSWNFGIDSMTK